MQGRLGSLGSGLRRGFQLRLGFQLALHRSGLDLVEGQSGLIGRLPLFILLLSILQFQAGRVQGPPAGLQLLHPGSILGLAAVQLLLGILQLFLRVIQLLAGGSDLCLCIGQLLVGLLLGLGQFLLCV